MELVQQHYFFSHSKRKKENSDFNLNNAIERCRCCKIKFIFDTLVYNGYYLGLCSFCNKILEPLQYPESKFLTLLRVKLGCKDILLPDHRCECHSVVGRGCN